MKGGGSVTVSALVDRSSTGLRPGRPGLASTLLLHSPAFIARFSLHNYYYRIQPSYASSLTADVIINFLCSECVLIILNL